MYASRKYILNCLAKYYYFEKKKFFFSKYMYQYLLAFYLVKNIRFAGGLNELNPKCKRQIVSGFNQFYAGSVRIIQFNLLA